MTGEVTAYARMNVKLADGSSYQIRNKSRLNPADFMAFLKANEWIQIGSDSLMQISQISCVNFYEDESPYCQGEI